MINRLQRKNANPRDRSKNNLSNKKNKEAEIHKNLIEQNQRKIQERNGLSLLIHMTKKDIKKRQNFVHLNNVSFDI